MCENCNCMDLDKNNNKFLAINENNIIKIDDIEIIHIGDNDLCIDARKIFFRISFDDIITENSLISDNIINFASDIINNIYDDFSKSNFREILFRKLFIYLTVIMCEEYTIASCVNTFMYMDTCLESLITDCSTIMCRIEFYKNENDEYMFWAKHHDSSIIDFSGKNKVDFEDMFKAWVCLSDTVRNFEVYD